MKEFFLYLYPILKKIVNASATLAKLSLGIGLLVITIYFMRINYFPTDLSVGDGLVFIFVSLKLFILFMLFITSHYSLGKNIKILSLLIWRVMVFLKNILLHRRVVSRLDFRVDPLKNIIFFIVSIILIIFIFYFYDGIFSLGLNQSIVNIGVFIISCYFITWVVDKIVHDLKYPDSTEPVNFRNEKIFIKLLVIILIVLGYSFFFQTSKENRFLSFSSSLVREQNNKKTIVYVKKDYKDFFPDKSVVDAKGDYIPLHNVEVVLRGIGKNAILQYKVKSSNNKLEKQKIEIPNDALLIVKKD